MFNALNSSNEKVFNKQMPSLTNFNKMNSTNNRNEYSILDDVSFDTNELNENISMDNQLVQEKMAENAQINLNSGYFFI
jgi:hypothetical protein